MIASGAVLQDQRRCPPHNSELREQAGQIEIKARASACRIVDLKIAAFNVAELIDRPPTALTLKAAAAAEPAAWRSAT